jgi:dihydroxyacid dehydratase/phosphogluconate dehydratase
MTLRASLMGGSAAGTSALALAVIDDELTRISVVHTFFSSHGFVVGHVVPEAQVGGPIALVEDGDMIAIDAVKNTIDVLNISEDEWARRRSRWKAPELKVKQGTLYKYAKTVEDASMGCITDA